MKTMFKLLIICFLLSSIISQPTCLSTQFLIPVANDASGTGLNPQCFLIRHYIPNCKYYRLYNMTTFICFGCW